MSFLKSCRDCADVYTHSFDDNAILTGASDTIIVKQKNGTYRSTPFLVCFGPYYHTHSNQQVYIKVNDVRIP